MGIAIGVQELDTNDLVAFHDDIAHAYLLMSIDTVLASVVEHHLIELAADHLPGLRTLVGFVVVEIKRSRELATGVNELNAVLVNETTGLHLGQHIQAFQHPVRLRD